MCFLVLGSCKDEVETKTNGFVVTVRAGHLDALVLLGDMALACFAVCLLANQKRRLNTGYFHGAAEYRS